MILGLTVTAISTESSNGDESQVSQFLQVEIQAIADGVQGFSAQVSAVIESESSGNNTLLADISGETIYGGAGDDQLTGQSGNDILFG